MSSYRGKHGALVAADGLAVTIDNTSIVACLCHYCLLIDADTPTAEAAASQFQDIEFEQETISNFAGRPADSHRNLTHPWCLAFYPIHLYQPRCFLPEATSL